MLPHDVLGSRWYLLPTSLSSAFWFFNDTPGFNSWSFRIFSVVAPPPNRSSSQNLSLQEEGAVEEEHGRWSRVLGPTVRRRGGGYCERGVCTYGNEERRIGKRSLSKLSHSTTTLPPSARSPTLAPPLQRGSLLPCYNYLKKQRVQILAHWFHLVSFSDKCSRLEWRNTTLWGISTYCPLVPVIQSLVNIQN